MESLVILIVGLCIGSFLNVVIHRLPIKKSIVFPASHCPKCKGVIPVYANLPLVGFLLCRGQCVKCHQKISLQYPIVELLTGIAFVFSYHGIPEHFSEVISQLRVWTFVALGISIFFIDLKHRIIPDVLSLGGWGFGLLTCFFDARLEPLELVLSSIGGFGGLLGFAVLYERLTGRMGLGGGDIKFMGTIGVFLGVSGLWTSLMVGSILGSIVGGIWMAWVKAKGPKLQFAIPYGPFLVIGAFLELYFEISKWWMQ